MDAKRTGVLAILGASMMWAVEPLVAKAAYRTSGFLDLSTIRAAVVAATACLYVLATHRGSFRIARPHLSIVVYIALTGTVAADTLYFFALTKTAVINAVLIAHLQPIFIVLFGFLVMHEGLTRYDYGGIAVMILSGLLVTTQTWDNLIQIRLGGAGDLYILLATVLWATTALAMRKYLREVHSGVITFYRYLIAASAFTIYLVAAGGTLRPNVYEVLIGVTTATGTILYYEAMKRLKAAQVSALELSTPLFAMVLVLLARTETVTAMQIAGVLLLAGGVRLLSRPEIHPGIGARRIGEARRWRSWSGN